MNLPHDWAIEGDFIKELSGAEARALIKDSDLILLDEFTYPLQYGWLDVREVVAWLKEHKPPGLHLIITGRDAPVELIEAADMVTDMQLVRHPFASGITAQPGIEF